MTRAAERHTRRAAAHRSTGRGASVRPRRIEGFPVAVGTVEGGTEAVTFTPTDGPSETGQSDEIWVKGI